MQLNNKFKFFVALKIFEVLESRGPKVTHEKDLTNPKFQSNMRFFEFKTFPWHFWKFNRHLGILSDFLENKF